MNNIKQALTNEANKELLRTMENVNNIKSYSSLDWQLKSYLPKGKDLSILSPGDAKDYLVKRIEKAKAKSLEKKIVEVNRIMSAGELVSVKINVEWKKSRTWGANPIGQAWCQEGNTSKHFKSGSIGGCGYDKLSTAVAKCLNQMDAVLKVLYLKREYNIDASLRELFGYGSGYGILPYIEGGVGVSCYPRIFESVGYKFETVASGDSFDAFKINKI